MNIFGGVLSLRTVRAFGPQDLRVIDVEQPTILHANEVKVAVKACGICGSDKWFWKVEQPSDYTAGHEVAGQIVEVGSKVTQFKPGDRVALNNVKGCGHCEECLAGRFVRCINGIEHMGQGFSEYVVAPERNCLLLDDEISYELGSLIFDNWGTPYGAIARTPMQQGDIVIVSGCGPIGLAAIALATQRGAIVIAIDPLAYRRESALKQGAVNAFEPVSSMVTKCVHAMTDGRGADIVLECSGQPASYAIAFDAIRIGGTLVAIGEGAKFEFNVSEVMINKHLNFVGTLYSTMEQGKEVMDLIVKQQIDPLSIVTDRFSLEELPSKFGSVFESREGLLKTIVNVAH